MAQLTIMQHTATSPVLLTERNCMRGVNTMKEYLRPEFEEVKYDVKDCLTTSGGDSANWNAGGNDEDFPF